MRQPTEPAAVVTRQSNCQVGLVVRGAIEISKAIESPIFFAVAPMRKASLGEPGETRITDSFAKQVITVARKATEESFIFLANEPMLSGCGGLRDPNGEESGEHNARWWQVGPVQTA